MDIFSLSSLTAFVICELLAGLVYLKNPKNKVNISFAVETLLIGVWTLSPYAAGVSRSNEEALLFTRLIYIAAILMPPAFLFFVYNLTGIHGIKKERNISAFFYIVSVFFLLNSFNPDFIKDVESSGLSFAVVPGTMYYLFSLFFAITIVFGCIKLFITYKEMAGFKKKQLLYILIAFVTAGIAGFIHLLSAYGVKEMYPHDLLVISFAAIVLYSIVRYRAMEVYIAFDKTMAYSLSAGLLTALFIVLVLAVTNVFSSFVEIHSFQISIFAALLIALLFNPFRNRIHTMIDRVFYKKSYDYYATIQQVGSTLASMFDSQEILQFTGDIIYEVMGLKSIYLLSAKTGGGYEVVYHISKKIKRGKNKAQPPDPEESIRIGNRSGIVRYCRKSGDIIIRDALPEIKATLERDMIGKIKDDLELFHAEAMVPVIVDNRLSVLIALGEKLSGDMFTGEDINLLNTISDQTAIAIKNAGLYKDKVHSEWLASIGMMSATFAHEIRNPLTSLKTFAQLMPEKYNDAEFRDTFSKIVEGEIEKIDGLIGDLLDFSTEKKSSRNNNFNLVALVDETVDCVRKKMELENKKIDIRKTYNGDKVYMSGDAAKLKQTFINILTNGCQAMHGEGVLTVKIKPNGEYIDVTVVDTGEGIDAGDILKIFDPFVTSKDMGLGLGLAISKRIIEDHNGRINVKSKLSKGATFTVSLPVQN